MRAGTARGEDGPQGHQPQSPRSRRTTATGVHGVGSADGGFGGAGRAGRAEGSEACADPAGEPEIAASGGGRCAYPDVSPSTKALRSTPKIAGHSSTLTPVRVPLMGITVATAFRC